jgi:lipopolysaccharide assembly protein A
MQVVRWIIGAVIFLALLFLSLQNAAPVELNFFNLARWSAPLVFVLFVAFAAGVAAGLLAGAIRTARVNRQLRELRRERRKIESAEAALADGKAQQHGFARPGRTSARVDRSDV